jgi:hypothetical protein
MPDFGFQLYAIPGMLVNQAANAPTHRSDIQVQISHHFCQRMALTTTEPA